MCMDFWGPSPARAMGEGLAGQNAEAGDAQPPGPCLQLRARHLDQVLRPQIEKSFRAPLDS